MSLAARLFPWVLAVATLLAWSRLAALWADASLAFRAGGGGATLGLAAAALFAFLRPALGRALERRLQAPRGALLLLPLLLGALLAPLLVARTCALLGVWGLLAAGLHPQSPRGLRWAWGSVLALGLSLRLGLLLSVPWPYWAPDSAGYVSAVHALLAGEGGATLDPRRTPTFPLLVLLGLGATGSYLGVLALAHGLGLGAAWCAGRLLRPVAGELGAWLCFAWLALFPKLIEYEHAVLAEGTFVACLALAAALAARTLAPRVAPAWAEAPAGGEERAAALAGAGADGSSGRGPAEPAAAGPGEGAPALGEADAPAPAADLAAARPEPQRAPVAAGAPAPLAAGARAPLALGPLALGPVAASALGPVAASAFALGLLSSLAALARPAGLAVLPLVLLAGLLARRGAAFVLALALGLGAPLLLWAAHNRATHGFFGLTRLGGQALFGGAGHLVDPDSPGHEELKAEMRAGLARHNARRPSWDPEFNWLLFAPDGPLGGPRFRALPEVEQHRALEEITRQAIAARPLDFAARCAYQGWRYLNQPARYAILPWPYPAEPERDARAHLAASEGGARWLAARAPLPRLYDALARVMNLISLLPFELAEHPLAALLLLALAARRRRAGPALGLCALSALALVAAVCVLNDPLTRYHLQTVPLLAVGLTLLLGTPGARGGASAARATPCPPA